MNSNKYFEANVAELLLVPKGTITRCGADCMLSGEGGAEIFALPAKHLSPKAPWTDGTMQTTSHQLQSPKGEDVPRASWYEMMLKELHSQLTKASSGAILRTKSNMGSQREGT